MLWLISFGMDYLSCEEHDASGNSAYEASALSDNNDQLNESNAISVLHVFLSIIYHKLYVAKWIVLYFVDTLHWTDVFIVNRVKWYKLMTMIYTTKRYA